MDSISSAKFRKVYAKLTDRTTVTVNGHPIGEWVPVNAPTYRMTPGPRLVADEDVVDFAIGTEAQQKKAAERLAAGRPDTTLIEDWSARPVRAVPKKR